MGRDGCRVPLPWTREGSSFGFGPGKAHLPQPATFGALSVEAQDGVPGSTLELYRAALALRHELQADEKLEWLPAPTDVLHFARPNGWHVVTNFGTDEVPLPEGEVLLTSEPLTGNLLPASTTAWLRAV
jgi:alpha-glucosidase